ncbi:MAG: hypothetical protein ACK5PB_12290, partial [Pirellula sp.]
ALFNRHEALWFLPAVVFWLTRGRSPRLQKLRTELLELRLQKNGSTRTVFGNTQCLLNRKQNNKTTGSYRSFFLRRSIV